MVSADFRDSMILVVKKGVVSRELLAACSKVEAKLEELHRFFFKDYLLKAECYQEILSMCYQVKDFKVEGASARVLTEYVISYAELLIRELASITAPKYSDHYLGHLTPKQLYVDWVTLEFYEGIVMPSGEALKSMRKFVRYYRDLGEDGLHSLNKNYYSVYLTMVNFINNSGTETRREDVFMIDRLEHLTQKLHADLVLCKHLGG